MKKILLTPFIFITLLFTSSCVDKSEDEIRMLGTWIIESDLLKWTDSTGKTSFSVANRHLNSCTKKEKMVFTDKELTIFSYEVLSDGSCVETITSSSYAVSDKQLSFYVFGKKVSFEFEYYSTYFYIKTPVENEEGEYNKKIVQRYSKQ